MPEAWCECLLDEARGFLSIQRGDPAIGFLLDPAQAGFEFDETAERSMMNETPTPRVYERNWRRRQAGEGIARPHCRCAAFLG